jgi:DNA-directed RNA polymerase specialized sigma subunit
MLDLIEEGNIGLMDAVRSFAEKPIGDFTAHAAACIEDAIAKVLGKSKQRSLAMYRHYAQQPAK